MDTTKYIKSIKLAPTSPAPSGLYVLKPGKYNKKIGARLLKGRWKGAMLYCLTLIERSTCWSGCQNWDRCYGNNMPFAHRYQPGPALEEALYQDLRTLQVIHTQPFAVRLHVLGDFYSTGYVSFWQDCLDAFPGLRIWGYTHWRYHSDIGAAVTQLALNNPNEVAILRSDPTEPDDPLASAVTVTQDQEVPTEAIVCPEQASKTASCATCGLCMAGIHNIAFLDHGNSAARSALHKRITNA